MTLRRRVAKIIIMLVAISLLTIPTVSADNDRCEMEVAPKKNGYKNSLTTQRESYGKKVQELQKSCNFIGAYKSTAYSPSAGGINVEAGSEDLVATGNKITLGRTVAVDHLTIPYGSVLAIRVPSMPQYNGLYLAEDTGGAIVYNRIDMMIEPYTKAMEFGERDIDIHVLEYGTGAQDARDKAKNWDKYIEKYKDYTSSGFKYGVPESEQKKEAEKEIKEGKKKGYTKKDYFLYREKVENEGLGAKKSNVPFGKELVNSAYQFSDKTSNLLLKLGWLLSGLVLIYLAVSVLAYVLVQRGTSDGTMFNKMTGISMESSSGMNRPVVRLFLNMFVCILFIGIFATGLYIKVMGLVIGAIENILTLF